MNSPPGKNVLWFPSWPDALRQVRLPALRQQQYRQALIRYLRFCRETRQPATVASARAFMETVHAQRMLSFSMVATWKEAINWFFEEARKQRSAGVPPVSFGAARQNRRDACATSHRRDGRATITDVPSLGAADLGKTDWEKKLIRVLRSRHYQWRTEQTYRQWAGRFAAWLERRAPSRPNPPIGHDGAWPSKRIESATAADVRDFLTDLATRSRVSASTQKQALNALVFLLREALERDPGDFGDYARAAAPVRIPVVLSREECQQLFAAMEGTPRLMAELMYGSGLRLTELLRLRVPLLSP